MSSSLNEDNSSDSEDEDEDLFELARKVSLLAMGKGSESLIITP
jgi:hypothetical protein